MRFNSRWAAVAAMAAGLFAAGVTVHAQGAPDAPPPPDRGGPAMFERFGEPEVDFVAFEGPISRKTVTGAPFSATFTSQSSQTLADGNHIQHSTTGSIARDSQGRTRRDMTLPAIRGLATSGQSTPRHVVMINDVVAGTHYILHPEKKTAETRSGKGRGFRAGDRMGHGHGGPKGAAWAGKRNSAEVTTASLGTQTIGGVTAEGTRYTRTIPAGEIGNEKPIQIVIDKWYSADLQMNVIVKRTDPLHGDSTYQLTEIQRSEPAATMFQVPADYTVNAAPARHGRMQAAPAAPQE